MIVRCEICRKKIDVRESEFNAIADFASKFETTAKFRCDDCLRKIGGEPKHYVMREDNVE